MKVILVIAFIIIGIILDKYPNLSRVFWGVVVTCLFILLSIKGLIMLKSEIFMERISGLDHSYNNYCEPNLYVYIF